MKIFILSLFISLTSCKIINKKTSYIPQCENLVFDLSDGTINGVKPNLPQAQIKEWFPCYTKFSPDGGQSDCGGAIFYANHDFYFYTYVDDYVEVKSGFKGTITENLMGKSRDQVRLYLGKPIENKHSAEDPNIDFFATKYGCIRVHYKDNIATLIAAHYSDCESVEWCKN
jgi:hypothetical protein